MNSTVSKIKTCEFRTVVTGPFYKCELYNQAGDVVSSHWLEEPLHLDNKRETDCMPFQQGVDEVAAKINRAVTINGAKRWIRANTEQEYADKLMKLVNSEPTEEEKHAFSEYAWNWFKTYSEPIHATATVRLNSQLLRCHILPVLGEIPIEDITSDDAQRMFNAMDTSKETKHKARRLLNQILDAAAEDNIIVKNPARSKRIKISGAESTTTEPYSVEQMQYLVEHIGDLKQERDRAYMALHTMHPLRLEEVLGLKWGDIDVENGVIHVRRAVTHPDRNRPEIKETKTKGSIRDIGFVRSALLFMTPGRPEDFVVGGEEPLSYSNVRRMRERIRRETKFEEKVTPMRFRTTVLSDLYDQKKDIKLTQAAAGHTTAEMTLRHYVKGRSNVIESAEAIEALYTAKLAEKLQASKPAND